MTNFGKEFLHKPLVFQRTNRKILLVSLWFNGHEACRIASLLHYNNFFIQLLISKCQMIANFIKILSKKYSKAENNKLFIRKYSNVTAKIKSCYIYNLLANFYWTPPVENLINYSIWKWKKILRSQFLYWLLLTDITHRTELMFKPYKLIVTITLTLKCLLAMVLTAHISIWAVNIQGCYRIRFPRA